MQSAPSPDAAVATAPARTRINPASVRSLDIRGVVDQDVDVVDARLLGGAYAALARDQGLRRIGVGRDGRLSSPAFEAALVAGLVEGGMDVVRIGVGPTPMLAFAVRSLKLDGGVMVTASHNPPPENGFKLLLGADRIHGAALKALIARAPADPAPGGRAEERVVENAYVTQFLDLARQLAPMRVVWDAGSGASGRVLERLKPHLPGHHVLLNTEIDGRFPAHHADPAVEANMRQLQAAVVEHRCDLGIAFDGDADRIGAVDGEGVMVWADQLLLLLAQDLLEEHPAATLVADVKCSLVFFDGVRALGGRPVMAPSGYVLVRDAMRREGALLGGELSGHIFYHDGWDGTDDAIYVALRLLRALSRSGRSLADFRRALPRTVVTEEYRIACPPERKAAVVAEVSERLARAGADVERCDGLRVTTTDGWWLLRSSNTENKLTCRCEAADEAGLTRLLDSLRAELAASGVVLPA